ncbi:MAG: hypothetical protein K2M34_02440 [Alphaproteobacteria bacterium]|nr:hypothetical protein [Alphaproteobacteria bacterium]
MKKLAILPVLVLAGCATIVDGGPDTINLMTSDGSRVQAQVNSKSGTQQVTLPTLISVPKSCSDVTIQVIESDKIQQSVAVASSSVNPWGLGNIVLGGLIGLAVDAMTGDICTYSNSVVVPVYPK